MELSCSSVALFEIRKQDLLLVEEILHQLIGKYTIIYRVLYIPGGAGFLPSNVPNGCFQK